MMALMLVLRVALAAVFAVAAGAKFRSPIDTRRTFRALRLPLPHLLGWAVPSVEAATALLLVFWPVVGAPAALLLLTVFTMLMVADLAQGRATPCGCFGPRSSRPISARDVARNLLYMAAAIVVVIV